MFGRKKEEPVIAAPRTVADIIAPATGLIQSLRNHASNMQSEKARHEELIRASQEKIVFHEGETQQANAIADNLEKLIAIK